MRVSDMGMDMRDEGVGTRREVKGGGRSEGKRLWGDS